MSETATDTMTALAKIVADLEAAKRNVSWLLDHSNGSVDMHGLTYWAGRVERLREQIKAVL